MCPVAYQLLNEKFTLTEMQKAYEMIMERTFDKRNFRKKVITTEGLRELDEFSKSSSKRPEASAGPELLRHGNDRGLIVSRETFRKRLPAGNVSRETWKQT